MIVAHIGPSNLPILFDRGGATERRMRELASRQAQAGTRAVIYSAGEHNDVTEHAGSQVRSIACGRRGMLRAVEFLAKSLRDMRRLRPDVIHFHTVAEGAAFARMCGHGPSTKSVLSFDFFEFRRGRKNPFFPWYRRALASFSSLLPVSEYCRRESSAYWSIPASQMRVLYNGVSLQQFSPDQQAAAQRRAALGLTPQDFVLLYVGRVCRQKGTDLLVEAYARLRAQRPHVRLVVAGPTGQFGHSHPSDITQALAQHQGLYLGPVEESALRSVYCMADVFVMPTRTHEMFGMAALEAQACGRPVVCSTNGGLPEVVSPQSGLLFRSGDLDELTQRLQTLVDNPSLHSRLSASAVGNAKRFAWESITTELDQIYRQALS